MLILFTVRDWPRKFISIVLFFFSFLFFLFVYNSMRQWKLIFNKKYFFVQYNFLQCNKKCLAVSSDFPHEHNAFGIKLARYKSLLNIREVPTFFTFKKRLQFKYFRNKKIPCYFSSGDRYLNVLQSRLRNRCSALNSDSRLTVNFSHPVSQ
jgi:hypothetical protein